MKKNRMQYLETELIVGHQNQNKLRAIFCIVPHEIKKQRAKAVAYKAKNRNYTVQKEYEIWTGINVFITNVDKEWLTTEQIINTYRLRWQVELVFKTWKSHYQIDQYKTMRKERIECYLYATLLLILLHWKIFIWLNLKAFHKKMDLSLHKFSKLMIHLTTLFNETIIRSKCKLEFFFLSSILQLAELYSEKEKKKNKISFSDIVHMKTYVPY